MTKDVRASLDRLIAALETHFAAAQGKRGDFDAAVETAYSRLADAFDEYDDALFQRYDETTPLALYDDDDFDYVDESDEDESDVLSADDEFDMVEEDDQAAGFSSGSGAQFDAQVDPVQDSWIEVADTEPTAAG